MLFEDGVEKTAKTCIFHILIQFWVKILSKLPAIYDRYSSTTREREREKINEKYFQKGEM